MYLLDTNTLIYFFKGQGRVAERLLSTSPMEVAVPTLVIYEIEVGIAKSAQPVKRRRQLAELLSVIKVVPFDQAAASAAAGVRAALEGRGHPIGPLDTLIAGTAIAQRAILVTHNTREFKRVPKLFLADWYE
ncbi:MAG: type II toxin-antitoxin system VapC family toxin [Gammaproteobacteria bacterium]